MSLQSYIRHGDSITEDSKKKKKKNANADSKWVSWWEREKVRDDDGGRRNRMDMQLQTQNRSWELVLSCCVSGRLLWSLSLQPVGCPATTWYSAGELNKSLEHTHTHTESSLPFAWQSQDCPLVTPMLCTATVLALVCSFNWFLEKGEQGNNEKQTIKKCKNQLK